MLPLGAEGPPRLGREPPQSHGSIPSSRTAVVAAGMVVVGRVTTRDPLATGKGEASLGGTTRAVAVVGGTPSLEGAAEIGRETTKATSRLALAADEEEGEEEGEEGEGGGITTTTVIAPTTPAATLAVPTPTVPLSPSPPNKLPRPPLSKTTVFIYSRTIEKKVLLSSWLEGILPENP